MPTQAIAGFNALMYTSVDGGSSYQKLGELTDVTLTFEMDAIETTSHDSGGFREFIGGLAAWTATAEAMYLSADASQADAFNALVNKTAIKFRFLPKTGSGLPKYEGDGIITSWELSGPLDDAAALSLEVTGTGQLAKGTQ